MNINSFLNNYDLRNTEKILPLINEFFQSEIITYISSQDYWENMVLIWGSALRLLYWSLRFSEDLDYDAFWIDYNDFLFICNDISKYLESKWYKTSITTSKSNNWHCNFVIKIELTTKEYWNIIIPAKIPLVIKMDVAEKNWNYTTEYRKLTNNFSDIYIKTPTINVLLSKKIIAFIERVHQKSLHKDIYDISTFMTYFSPDMEYLFNQLEVISVNQIIEIIDNRLNKLVLHDIEYIVNNASEILYSTEYLDNMYDIKNILMNWLNRQ